jgi:hypothetical protein
MTLGLHVSAHDPEAHQRLIISGHESRNDGVSKSRIAALGRKGIIAAFPFSLESWKNAGPGRLKISWPIRMSKPHFNVWRNTIQVVRFILLLSCVLK